MADLGSIGTTLYAPLGGATRYANTVPQWWGNSQATPSYLANTFISLGSPTTRYASAHAQWWGNSQAAASKVGYTYYTAIRGLLPASQFWSNIQSQPLKTSKTEVNYKPLDTSSRLFYPIAQFWGTTQAGSTHTAVGKEMLPQIFEVPLYVTGNFAEMVKLNLIGSISGIITLRGNRVANARVFLLRRSDMQRIRVTWTDALGQYSFTGLDASAVSRNAYLVEVRDPTNTYNIGRADHVSAE